MQILNNFDSLDNRELVSIIGGKKHGFNIYFKLRGNFHIGINF